MRFDEVYGGVEALTYTVLEASVSALLTVLIGLPIAWCLGRYQWGKRSHPKGSFFGPLCHARNCCCNGVFTAHQQ